MEKVWGFCVIIPSSTEGNEQTMLRNGRLCGDGGATLVL